MTKILFGIYWSAALLVAGDDLYALYDKNDFEHACLEAKKGYLNELHNGRYLSYMGFACLQSDNFNPMSIASFYLRQSPEERLRASYFATIALQKKLLFQFFFDKMPLSGLSLPKTDFYLSVIFDRIEKNRYRQEGNLTMIDTDSCLYKIRPDASAMQLHILCTDPKTGKTISQHTVW